MTDFQYQSPKTIQEIVLALGQDGQVLAGGQSLIAAIKHGLSQPSLLVDLKNIAELQTITLANDQLLIGAMVSHQLVANHPDIRQKISALAELANGIGDRQIRAMGTIGGSVANHDPAACYPSALLALGATVITSRRQIMADDFFTGIFTTALEPNEIITAISFPVPYKAAYAKFKQPASRFALIGVFVAVFAKEVRVAITGGGHGVFRHLSLEKALTKELHPNVIDTVKIDSTIFSSDQHATAIYRANLVRVQTKLAVQQILQKI